MDGPAPLLCMTGVSKRYGATHALRNVSLGAARGEILALLGENGAGKSTLMKVLAGACAADEGQITLDGQPFAPGSPLRARQAGVAMIYQELNLAADLSVEDNIMLGQETRRLGWLRRDVQRQKVHEALKLLGHETLQPETLVCALSVGERQLVEIARALVMSAKVIVLDEPTSSLPRQDVQRLFQVIRKLRDAGLAVIYISHFLEEIRDLADRYTVLRDGQSVGSGRLQDVSQSELVRLMVGRDVDELFPTLPHEPGDVILDVSNLAGASLPADVSLTLRRGEILGIAGLIGSGRTELLRCLFALDPIRGGTVTMVGNRHRTTPRGNIAAGMGLLSEDRKSEGLAQNCSITDNLTLSRLQPYSRLGWLNLGRRRQRVAGWMQEMEVKAQSSEQLVSELSGGNQQKVALARVLHQQADILLLDEPTRGIDVGTKAEIYRRMGELAAAGKAILFVSSYIPELLAVCDRVAVMARGRIRDIRAAANWTESDVLACAVELDQTTAAQNNIGRAVVTATIADALSPNSKHTSP